MRGVKSKKLMKDQFIPYELALELKKLGFDEGCLTYYFIDGKMSNYFKIVHKNSRIIQTQPYKFDCTAPLWQQAFDWFREKYGLHVLLSAYYNECFYPKIEEINEPLKYFKDDLRIAGGFDYNNGRKVCLEKLIEIVKKYEKI